MIYFFVCVYIIIFVKYADILSVELLIISSYFYSHDRIKSAEFQIYGRDQGKILLAWT